MRGQRSECDLHLVPGFGGFNRGRTVNDRPRIATWKVESHTSGFESQQEKNNRNQSAASLLRQNQEATAASRCFQPRKETGEEARESQQQQQSEQKKTFSFSLFPLLMKQQCGSTHAGCPWTNQKSTIQQSKLNMSSLSCKCDGRKSVVLLEKDDCLRGNVLVLHSLHILLC